MVNEIISNDSDYLLGYIISSSALGIITACLDNNKCVNVKNILLPNIKDKLINNIEIFIENSDELNKENNNEVYIKLKKTFDVL